MSGVEQSVVQAAWRTAFAALQLTLAPLAGDDLVEAQAEVTCLLNDLAARERASGGEPLLKSALIAGKQATEGRCGASVIRSVFNAMSLDLCIEVDDAEPCSSLRSCARGSWTLFGMAYTFTAKVGQSSKGLEGFVTVDGLGFTASGKLLGGRLQPADALQAELQSRYGVGSQGCFSSADALRVLVVVLEILAKAKAEGIADVDVLDIAFRLMRQAAGVPTSTDPGAEEAEPEDEDNASSNAENTDEEQDGGSEDERVAQEGSEDESDAAANSGGEGVNVDVDACMESEKEEHKSANSEEEEEELESAKASDEGDSMLFVSSALLKEIGRKVGKDQPLQEAELVNLFDVSKLPDDEDLTPLDLTAFGDMLDLAAANLRGYNRAIAKHGPTKMAKAALEAAMGGMGSSSEESVFDEIPEGPTAKRLKVVV